MTALSTYGTTATSSTLSTACKLVTATGGSSTTVATSISGATYLELLSQGGSSTGQASLPAPTGHGWCLDASTLDGQTLSAGDYTFIAGVRIGSGTQASTTLTMRAYKYSSGGTYTPIASATSASFTLSSTMTYYTFVATGVSSMSFATGDKLYIDLWMGRAATSNRTVSVTVSSSSTAGYAQGVETDFPGYASAGGTTNQTPTGRLYLQPEPAYGGALTFYGSGIASETLTNAGKLSQGQTGGSETSATTTTTGTNIYAEIFSRAGSSTATGSIPSTPTGKGWAYRFPVAGNFAAGNWSASLTISASIWGNNPANSGLTLRAFKYSGGSYSLLGTLFTTISTTAKTTYTFSATSFAAASFSAGDILYFDLWWFDNNSSVSSDNPVIYQSNSPLLGVASDMQITTSTWSSPSTSANVHGSGRARLMALIQKRGIGRLKMAVAGMWKGAGRARVWGSVRRVGAGRARLMIGGWRAATGRVRMGRQTGQVSQGRARLRIQSARASIARVRLSILGGARVAMGRVRLRGATYLRGMGRVALARLNLGRLAMGRMRAAIRSARSSVGRVRLYGPTSLWARGRARVARLSNPWARGRLRMRWQSATHAMGRAILALRGQVWGMGRLALGLGKQHRGAGRVRILSSTYPGWPHRLPLQSPANLVTLTGSDGSIALVASNGQLSVGPASPGELSLMASNGHLALVASNGTLELLEPLTG